MIKIKKVEVNGFEAAIRGMRNPMNSWEKSDTVFFEDGEYHDICGSAGPAYMYEEGTKVGLGSNDHDLMARLATAGPVHGKFRRMIVVYLDITAPLYWWKEFDTYKIGTVANSCSTMHKIHAKEFTLEDFSCEHLLVADCRDLVNDDYESKMKVPELAGIAIAEDGTIGYYSPWFFLKMTCSVLNRYRKLFLETKDKRYWWQMIQLLPSSYNQKRTVMLNYEVLANIYRHRKDHKLDEWREFCEWIEGLPYSEMITGKEN